MRIAALWRYPVKSMLGEQLDVAHLDPAGLDGDRGLALIDATTGLVATAKQPRLWRDLLKYSATVDGDRVLITSPDGWTLDARDPEAAERLSVALGRPVRVASERPESAMLERPAPEDVLAHGVEAEVAAVTLVMGRGTPGTTFVDYAPVHVITSATVERIGTEYRRYRPNLVVETPPGTAPFVENAWVGRELHVASGEGGTAVLRVTEPTPRCAVPTLEHGGLPRAPHAVRTLMTANQVDVPGSGALPCAGSYAGVARGGAVHVGAEVELR